MRYFIQKLTCLTVTLLVSTGLCLAQSDAMRVQWSGKLREYFGQYNSGVPASSPYFQEFGEVNLGTNIYAGNLSGYFEVESRGNSIITAVQRRLDMKFAALKLSFGTIKPRESYALADDSLTGTMTSESVGFGFYKGELIKTELDGFRAEYKINQIKLGVTLYEADALNSKKYHLVNSGTTTLTDSSGDTSTAYTATDSGTKIKEYKAGSALQFGALGKLGPLEFHLSAIRSQTDDHTAQATVLSHSGNQAGLRYALGEGFSISVDQGSKRIAQDQSHNKLYEDHALQVSYRLQSKQTLVVTLANFSYQDEKYGDASKDYTQALANLVYSIPLGNRVAMKVLYGSETKTPALAASPARTKHFVGTGLLAKF